MKFHPKKKIMKRIKSKIKSIKADRNAVEPARRITNDTVAEHREEVLGKARKYIYPLQHSKHKLVTISISVFLVAVIVFFTYCTLALYKLQSTSTFLYRVTQVIPFPIARTGSDFIAYENYLFEINHYTHYYSKQQGLDFDSDAGKQQLAEFKKRALDKSINDAYIKKLAEQNGITVSDREVEDQITVVREQNRLGSNDKEFQAVLKDFWGWSESDFKRSLKSQLLSQKVVATLDTSTQDRANAVMARLNAGEDFSTVASEISEDPSSKSMGGDFGFLIDKSNRDIDPLTVDALFKLKEGEYSQPINIGHGLEIVKNVKVESDGKLKAQHIVFNFKDINEYTNEMKDQQKTRVYLRF